MSKRQHVVPHERGWAVIADGAESPSAIFKVQSDAWEKAKALARKERSEALLHGKNGHVRAHNIYGHEQRRTPG